MKEVKHCYTDHVELLPGLNVQIGLSAKSVKKILLVSLCKINWSQHFWDIYCYAFVRWHIFFLCQKLLVWTLSKEDNEIICHCIIAQMQTYVRSRMCFCADYVSHLWLSFTAALDSAEHLSLCCPSVRNGAAQKHWALDWAACVSWIDINVAAVSDLIPPCCFCCSPWR